MPPPTEEAKCHLCLRNVECYLCLRKDRAATGSPSAVTIVPMSMAVFFMARSFCGEACLTGYSVPGVAGSGDDASSAGPLVIDACDVQVCGRIRSCGADAHDAAHARTIR